MCAGPTLFSILFTTMLSDAFAENEDSIKLCFHYHRNLFNLRRLQAQTKVKITSVHGLLFADDCALNVSSEGLQQSMNNFSSACDAFGVTNSTPKMQVMCQPAPHTTWPNPSITVKGNALEVVDKFTYLSSVLSKNVTIDDEVNNRLSKASATFSRLSKMSGIMKAYLHIQSSKCTRLLFSQPFCMPVRHGLCTAGMSRNSTGFTSIVCSGFSISYGGTGSLTLRFLTVLSS